MTTEPMAPANGDGAASRDLESEIAQLRTELEATRQMAGVALKAAEGWQQAATEAQARASKLRNMFLLLAEFSTPLPAFSMEGLRHQLEELDCSEYALLQYGRQQRERCAELLRTLPPATSLEAAAELIRQLPEEAHYDPVALERETLDGADLRYIDPESTDAAERTLHLVSGLAAGRAYNDLCRMLGGRWPDCRLMVEAPLAHQFFMALLSPPDFQAVANDICAERGAA